MTCICLGLNMSAFIMNRIWYRWHKHAVNSVISNFFYTKNATLHWNEMQLQGISVYLTNIEAVEKRTYLIPTHSKTRQKSMQGVENMPPPPPPQQVQMAPKRLKPTDRDQNLIILDTSGGQDTSACQLWGHSSHGFSRNAQKPHFWPVSFSQNSVKMSKIIRPKLRSNLYCKWSGYIGMPNCKSFFPCVLKKMHGNLSGLNMLTEFVKWDSLMPGTGHRQATVMLTVTFLMCVHVCVPCEWWSGACMCDGSLLNSCYLCRLWYIKP